MITTKATTHLEVKALDDDGAFEGYGAVFGNIDLGLDTISKGAFKASLAEARRVKRMPRFLLSHDVEKIAGIWTEMKEDDVGLRVTGRLNMEKQIGREAFSDLKLGALDGLSIGYTARKTARDEGTGIRTIKEAHLWEVSLVAFPMNEQARVTAVKTIAAQIKTRREFEEYLRDVGFSSAQAKGIASGGFRTDLRDEAVDAEALALHALTSVIDT